MKINACIVAVLSLLFVACGGTRMAVNPNWTTTPDKFTVLISEPYVANSDDVTDDFGDNDAFKQWVADYLNESIGSYSKKNTVHAIKLVDDNWFVTTQLPLGEGEISVPLPKKEMMDGITGVVVNVHPMRFWRETDMCHSRNGCMNNHSLNLKVMYSIVSVEDGNVLAYGGAYDKSSFTFAMTKGNWESVIEGVAKKIVEKTPLEK
jgi:hypothetical protein